MGTKFLKIVVSTLLAGSAVLALAGPAAANRGGEYTPPGDDGVTEVTVPVDLDPSGDGEPVINGGTDVPTGDGQVRPEGSPAVDVSGDGITADPVSGAPGTDILGAVESSGVTPAPKAEERPRGGILSRTGAETMTLVRVGLAALALGVGFVVLNRRRRPGFTAA